MTGLTGSKSMRVCLVGDTEGNIDEGMKKVAVSLAEELRKRHDVHIFNPTKPQRLDSWLAVRRFRPDVIHYVPGPSAMSFVIARALSRLAQRTPVVMSAIHPKGLWPRWLLRILCPKVVLVQSSRAERFFHDLDISIRYVPVGVDSSVYCPAGPKLKLHLRQRYGINPDSFVILHVGNISESRNIRILSDFCESDTEVIVVASTSVKKDSNLLSELRRKGVHVWTHYIPNIYEVYQLGDLYVFPVRDMAGAIQFPLSILEAMATNLPVVSTPFGGLPVFLTEGNGFRWLHTDDELADHISRFRAGGIDVNTRAIVERFSWEFVVQEIEAVYADVLSS